MNKSEWNPVPYKKTKSFYAKREVEQLEQELYGLGFKITVYFIIGGTYKIQKDGKTICEGSSREVCYFMEGVKLGMNHG